LSRYTENVNHLLPQAGKSRVRFPILLDFSIELALPAKLCLWGGLSLQQKCVPGIFLGEKGGWCVRLITSHFNRIRTVTSGELLTKQTMKKKLSYAKYTYILKLLLSMDTTGAEALVVSENKFLYASVKEVCRL
jgi:hypothetical protein